MATIGEIIRAVLIHDVAASGEAQLVFHFQIGTANPSDDDVLAALDTWATDEWGAIWEDDADSDSVITAVEASVVNTDGTVDRDIGVAAVGKFGTDVGPVLPAGVSGLLYAPTANPKIRGRKFIPGMSATNITEGLFSPGSLATLAGLAAIYITPIEETVSGAFLNPGVLSTSLAAFVPFLDTAIATNVPAYQRRRRPGSGV